MFDVCICAPLDGRDVNQWDYLLSHWSPRHIYVIGALPDGFNLSKPYTCVVSAEELPAESEIVLMAPQNARYFSGTHPLHRFSHPDDCIYIFGSNHRHVSEDELGERVPDHSIYIPTDSKDEMYSYVAAGVVMWDRVVKTHG